MTRNEQLASSLRALADAIEHLPAHLEPYVDCKCHGIQSLDSLRAVAALMDKPRASQSMGSSCWIYGEFALHVNVTAFYRPGLLGEVVQTGKTDLSLLEVA